MYPFEVKGFYPPEEHEERLKKGRKNKELFKGNHFEVFETMSPALTKRQAKDIYISANLPGLICKKSADFLFGEVPTFSAGREDDSPEQKAIERLVTENDLNITNYEEALGNAYQGDAFYKLRWGQQWNGMLDEKMDPYRVFIQSQNGQYVFPETLPGDAKNVFAYHIAFPVEVPGSKGEDFFLQVESHYPGSIVYKQFKMSPYMHNTDGTVTKFRIYAEIEGEKVVNTGVPFPLIVHVPNYALEDSWEGLDDLTEHVALFDELNNRLSLIAEILDKHSDPMLAVPTGSLDEDEDGNPIFHAQRDKSFEYEKGDAEPKYITWNGQLDAAFKELEKLIDLILMCTEIPPIVIGKDNSGTSGSSGIAIKHRMNNLLAKIRRKRQYFAKGLKRVLLIAQLLEHAKMEKVDYEVITSPIVKFRDGLPDDDLEQANIMSIRTGGKATISQKNAIMEMDDLTEEQAMEVLKSIQEEEDAESYVDSTVFNKETPIQQNEPQEE